MKNLDWDFIGAICIAIVGLFVVVIISSGIIGCNGTTYQEQSGSQEPPTYASLRTSVFEPSCIACHQAGGPRDLTTYQAVLKYVVPGNPEASPLYKRLASGSMPPAAKLPDSFIRSVYEWIADGVPQF